MFGRTENGQRISSPFIRNIGIELELVPVRIGDIEAVGNRMVGSADDSNTLPGKLTIDLLQCLGSIAHLETDMVETGSRYAMQARSTTDFD